MKIQRKAFANDYREEGAGKGMDPNEVGSYMKGFYEDNSPLYLKSDPISSKEDRKKVEKQVQAMCDSMQAAGLTKFAGLVENLKMHLKMHLKIRMKLLS